MIAEREWDPPPPRPAIASARGLSRVEPGKGRKDRDTRLSSRLLTARRASWQRSRPAPWLCTGRDPPTPLPIGTAQTSSSHAPRRAGSTHGQGLPTLRHCCATHRLEAGAEVWTIPLWLGQQARDTPTRSLRITRPPLATIRSPCDRLPCGDPPLPTPEYRHATACHRRPTRHRGGPGQPPTGGSRRSLPPLRRDRLP